MNSQIVVSVMADIASALQILGGQTVSELVASHVRRKTQEARDILLESLRQGNVSIYEAVGKDEFISCLWRYSRASLEGAAQANLKLLANALSGLIERDAVYAERFKRYADVLSGLTSEEIIVLGRLHQICSSGVENAGDALAKLNILLVPSVITSEKHLYALLTGISRTGLVSQGSGTMDDMGGWTTTPLMDEVAELTRVHEILDTTN